MSVQGTRSPDTVKRDAELTDLRAKGWTYRQLGARYGISAQAAHLAVQRVLADTIREPAANLRTVELEKLDHEERIAHDVLSARHPVLYQGEDTGYEDDGPKLSAIDRLLKIAERRARLLGLDAPQQVESSVTTISPDLAALIERARGQVDGQAGTATE
jgi:hypothetical protein